MTGTGGGSACSRPRPSLTACSGRRAGNRRAAVCAPCAETYCQDAYQLLMAGLVGGKGVPESVGEHPMAFVTLTAPSFGAVPHHTRGRGRSGACLSPTA